MQQINATTGTAVGNPVEVSGAGALNNDDKEWIVADANPAARFATTCMSSGRGSRAPRMSCSPGRPTVALNWSAASQLDNSEGFVWPSHIAVAPNGDVYVTYHSRYLRFGHRADVRAERHDRRHAIPGGGGLSEDVVHLGGDLQRAVCRCDGAIPNTTFWMQGANQGFVIPDPVRPGQIYVVANDDPNDDFTSGDGGDVILARSFDNGLTWNVSTISHGPVGTFQVYPTGAIDQLGNLVSPGGIRGAD